MPTLLSSSPSDILTTTTDQLSNTTTAPLIYSDVINQGDLIDGRAHNIILLESLNATKTLNFVDEQPLDLTTVPATKLLNNTACNPTTSDVYTASEMFTIEVDQRSNATFDPLNLIYAFILNGPDYVEMYNVFSYSSLVYALNKVGSNSLINGTSNPVLQHLKPLVANPKYKFTNDTSGFVSRVAYCKFPFQCILSHATDPLLIRIHELYNIVIDMFTKTKPGNLKYMKSIYNVPGSQGVFRIPKPKCYKHAYCYGLSPNTKSRIIKFWHEMTNSTFTEMNKKEKSVLSLPSYSLFKHPRYCGQIVFMCNASGECSTLLLSELKQELNRGINYIKAKVRPFSEMNELLCMQTEEWYFYELLSCKNIFIYSSTSGSFIVSPAAAEPLLLYLNKYLNFFSKFVQIFFGPLLNVKQNKLCPQGNCLVIQFKNNLEDPMRKEPLFLDLTNITCYAIPKPFILFPSNTIIYTEPYPRVVRNVKSDNLNENAILSNNTESSKNDLKIGGFQAASWASLVLFGVVMLILGSATFKKVSAKHSEKSIFE